LLDTVNPVLDMVEVYTGSVNSSQVHVAELFKPVVRRNATAIIVAHTQPGGDPTLSSVDDVSVIRAIVLAGKLLSVEVLDHLGDDGCRSKNAAWGLHKQTGRRVPSCLLMQENNLFIRLCQVINQRLFFLRIQSRSARDHLVNETFPLRGCAMQPGKAADIMTGSAALLQQSLSIQRAGR
jgi:hypothetical protein